MVARRDVADARPHDPAVALLVGEDTIHAGRIQRQADLGRHVEVPARRNGVAQVVAAPVHPRLVRFLCARVGPLRHAQRHLEHTVDHQHLGPVARGLDDGRRREAGVCPPDELEAVLAAQGARPLGRLGDLAVQQVVARRAQHAVDAAEAGLLDVEQLPAHQLRVLDLAVLPGPEDREDDLRSGVGVRFGRARPDRCQAQDPDDHGTARQPPASAHRHLPPPSPEAWTLRMIHAGTAALAKARVRRRSGGSREPGPRRKGARPAQDVQSNWPPACRTPGPSTFRRTSVRLDRRSLPERSVCGEERLL